MKKRTDIVYNSSTGGNHRSSGYHNRPENKKSEVISELNKAKARLEQQDAETPPADLSRCAPS